MKNQNSQESATVKTINSVERALDILELLSSCSRSQTVTEISNQLKINRATTYSLLNTLIKRDYITKTADAKYSITSRLYEMGTLYRNSFPVVHVMEQNISAMNSKFDCSIHLGIRTALGKGILLAAKSGKNELISLPEGYPIPLHATAIGKALLAFSPDECKNYVLSQKSLTRYTSTTITSSEALKRELDGIVKTGYSQDKGEFTPNLWCIAAPVYDNNGEVTAALSLSTTQEIMEANEDALVQEVKLFAQRLSFSLGYPYMPMLQL